MINPFARRSIFRVCCTTTGCYAEGMNKTTEYIGNMIYENWTLKRILIDGGYVEGGVGTVFAETPIAEQGLQPYKYNGKELDQMNGLNLYDYAAHNYDPAYGRFTNIDPMCEKYYSISPYVYCKNNPVRNIDPNGRDWVSVVKDEIIEVYYDRTVKLQEDVDKKYGEKAGVTHLSDGSTLTTYDKDGNVTAQYTFTNDSKDNKYGTVTDMNSNLMDNSQITYGSNYTIFGTSDNSVNAETLHKNMFGSSYIGPNNPKDYNGNDLYQYKPVWSPTEMAAFKHDLSYDALGARGIGGALSPSTKCADMQLIYDCQQVLKNPNSSPQEKSRAKKIITGFSVVDFFKPTAP